MKQGYVIPAKAAHVLELACTIRAEDRLEIGAHHRGSIMGALYRSYKVSTHCWTAMLDDKVMFMFGVSPISAVTRVGSPWLIAADGLEKVQRQFIKECRVHLQEIADVYPDLRNHVDVRNDAAIRWLEWMGFEMADPIPYGVNGEMFMPFTRSSASV